MVARRPDDTEVVPPFRFNLRSARERADPRAIFDLDQNERHEIVGRPILHHPRQ